MDDAEERSAKVRIFVLLRKKFGEGLDRRERIFDLVGQAGGKLPRGHEPFLMHQPVVGDAELVMGFLELLIRVGILNGHRRLVGQGREGVQVVPGVAFPRELLAQRQPPHQLLLDVPRHEEDRAKAGEHLVDGRRLR